MYLLVVIVMFFFSSSVHVGGTGCVLMVYGLNAEKMNCERIFNLFCLYGNVVKVSSHFDESCRAKLEWVCVDYAAPVGDYF